MSLSKIEESIENYSNAYFTKSNRYIFYNKAIELNPNDSNAYNNKGLALAGLKRHQEAIECFNKAIELNPNYSIAYCSKGSALGSLERHQESIECYNKAIEFNPNYSFAYNNKALL